VGFVAKWGAKARQVEGRMYLNMPQRIHSGYYNRRIYHPKRVTSKVTGGKKMCALANKARGRDGRNEATERGMTKRTGKKMDSRI
jgi:hypothetical protein